MHGCSGEDLLKRLADLWEKQTILVFWMQRVFQYLDRFFTRNSNEYPDLFSCALSSFQEKVYDKMKDSCIRALIETINAERNGREIDQDTVRLIVEMLCMVGDQQPKIAKQKDAGGDRLVWVSVSRTEEHRMDSYKQAFERVLLESTAEFYRTKVAGWLAELSCPMFLREVARTLENEESRLKRYLDRSSEKDLRKVCQRELILETAKQLVEMDCGCQFMFQNKKLGELALMHRIFRREPTVLCYMTEVMEPYIERRCTKIVDDQGMIDDPVKYIEEVLALKVELDDIVASCFENGPEFQKARNQGLENVLNKDTRCSKYLAIYCDVQLKKGFKGRHEEEVNAVINQVISLFLHLRDKDIFLDCYKKALSRRLLNRLSISNDAEDAFITKLKVECGQQAIQKLAAMFTDMSLSDALQEEYCRRPHGGSPGGVVHEVRVLQTNAWPEKADETNVVPCAEMAACIKAFEMFYNSKHSGRKLRWIYTMGQVEISAHCFQRKHILVVQPYQCLALMCFNQRFEVTFGELVEATKLPREECHRQVLSMTLAKHKLLKHGGDDKKLVDSTVLSVNEAFAHEKIKVVVGLIKEKEKPAEAPVAEAPVERKHVVDAAIVRIMKSRKRLDHISLLDEVFRQCTLFKPQPSLIKAQIETLIDREFLTRDAEQKSIYIYVP